MSSLLGYQFFFNLSQSRYFAIYRVELIHFVKEIPLESSSAISVHVRKRILFLKVKIAEEFQMRWLNVFVNFRAYVSGNSLEVTGP